MGMKKKNRIVPDSGIFILLFKGAVTQPQTGRGVATGTRVGTLAEDATGGGGQPAEQRAGHSPA